MVPQKTVLPVKINSSIFLLLILLKVMKKILLSENLKLSLWTVLKSAASPYCH